MNTGANKVAGMTGGSIVDRPALSGAGLEHLLDRLEADLQESDADAIDLLARLRAQPLRADTLEAIERLHGLWMRAGDTRSARAVIDHDGAALLPTLPPAERDDAAITLALRRLATEQLLWPQVTTESPQTRDAPILSALAQLREILQPSCKPRDASHVNHPLFYHLEYGPSLAVALEALALRHALQQANPQRAAYRAWDEASFQIHTARALARHGERTTARAAAHLATEALQTADEAQKVNAQDWLQLGRALIAIAPEHLPAIHDAVIARTLDCPLSQRRQIGGRLARLAARAHYAQGNLAAALESCAAARYSVGSGIPDPDLADVLDGRYSFEAYGAPRADAYTVFAMSSSEGFIDSDVYGLGGKDDFIQYELPWLLEAGRMEAAGQRAFFHLYQAATLPEGLWEGTLKLVHERLADDADASVWWPLCVMCACHGRQPVLYDLLWAAPGAELGGISAAHRAIFGARDRMDSDSDVDRDRIFRAARKMAAARAPEHVWIRRLAAAQDLEMQRGDAALSLRTLEAAIQEGELADSRSAFALFLARVKVLGLERALDFPPPQLESGLDACCFDDDICDVNDELLEQRPAAAQDIAQQKFTALRRAVCEHGLACMERYLETGQGHPGDACPRLYSRLCLTLAHIYFRHDNRYPEALALCRRGIAVHPTMEHYSEILEICEEMNDDAGIVEAAENCWPWVSANLADYLLAGAEYIGRVAEALYKLERDSEIPVWLERLTVWTRAAGVDADRLPENTLYDYLHVLSYMACRYPEESLLFWRRLQPQVEASSDASLHDLAGNLLQRLGLYAEAIHAYERSQTLAPDEDTRRILRELYAHLAAAKDSKPRWWQVWK
jgi:tetratricopeptide (TPR) repeat protein